MRFSRTSNRPPAPLSATIAAAGFGGGDPGVFPGSQRPQQRAQDHAQGPDAWATLDSGTSSALAIYTYLLPNACIIGYKLL
jgi:hypothetical protein